MANELSTKLQIQFTVREPASERYVTFHDEVEPTDIRDWFDRAAQGVQQMFRTDMFPVGIHLINAINVKIPAIKLVREYTGCGLKEAKDLVEGVGPGVSVGSVPSDLLFIVDNTSQAKRMVERFASMGITVAIHPVSVSTMIAQGVIKGVIPR